jgi:uncharacterized protein YuzE
MTVLVRYDAEADVTYVQLEPEPVVDRTLELLDAHLLVDVDQSGHPIGIEILCAPAEFDELALTTLAARFPDLDIGALGKALAVTKAATG